MTGAGAGAGDGPGAARRPWASLAALVGAAAACSTLADTPDPEECRSDADCADTYVCAVDQGRCLPGNEAAPRAHLGFDIRERGAGTILFRVEADGCDCTVEEEENIRELSLRRSLVSQMFYLDATVSTMELPEGPETTVPLAGRFELSQPSRHHQSPSPLVGGADYPTLVENGMDTLVVDTIIRWPRYHPLDQDVPPNLVLWKIEPDGYAPRYVGLSPPRTDPNRPCSVDADCCEPQGDCNPAPNFCDTVGECTAVGPAEWTYRLPYEPLCSRGLDGMVVTATAGEDPPLDDINVTVRYADLADERIGIPFFGNDAAIECEDDGDCQGTDEYCDPTRHECFVALAGRLANSGNSDLGKLTTPVYTYCEPDDVGVTRGYALTVQSEAPQPTVEYELEVGFTALTPLTNALLPGRACVPDWGPGATLELAFEGQPQTLAGAEGEYTCCDLGCLPASANDAAAGADAIPESCDGRTTTGVAPVVTLESHFVFDAETEATWVASECMLPKLDPQGRAGSLRLDASCTDACRVDGVALGTDAEPRRYDVRFESEPGSVLASRDFSIELGSTAPPRQTLSLGPRVLVTGVVDVDAAVCARRPTGEDCAAREAVVLAERLRLPNEPEGSVPGPYFHSVTTFYDPAAGRDGAFVLPLDPGGVYVITAMPLAGAEGGPAGFALVDLREGKTAEPQRLVLEDGVVVTLRLEQFDQRTTVIPLDRGSYLAPGKTLQLPELAGSEETIDLDEIGACWTPPKEGPQGCKIRRLIPPGYDLARSQVGVVRFTARRSDAAQCAVRCPMADPAE